MKKYGLIGKSLVHSQARQINAIIGDYDYNMIEVTDEGALETVLADREFSGFNVTSPYRISVMKYLDELDASAERIGAVNLIMRLPDGRLRGYNTDEQSFKYAAGDLVTGAKCLVLGSGGSAVACKLALESAGAEEVMLVSRDPEKAMERLGADIRVISWSRLYMHYDAQVIVNATPVGEFPEISHSPVTDQRLTVRLFTDLRLAFDLIYNPYRTKFLQDAKRLTNCHTKSGLDMLIIQALLARDIWEGTSTSAEEMDQLVKTIKRKILGEQLNVIAIGMPGGGKTTIFRRYAYEMGRRFIDTDELTEKLMGDTIPHILAEGEAGMDYFRAMEHEAVREACRSRGAVIATGGGTVLNPLNRDLLRSNGIVVYMRRPLELLDVKGRPYSKARGVAELFGERDRIYRRVSDMSILNSRIFGGVRKATGEGNTYNYELKGFVYYMARKIERYLNEIADNKWT